MEPEPAAVRRRVEKRVSALMESGAARTREIAILKIAESSDANDRRLWQDYRGLPAPELEPEPAAPGPVRSTAYEMLMAKAERRLRKDPAITSIAKAFEAEYVDVANAHLVQADKQAQAYAGATDVAKVDEQARVAMSRGQFQRTAERMQAAWTEYFITARGQSPKKAARSARRKLESTGVMDSFRAANKPMPSGLARR